MLTWNAQKHEISRASIIHDLQLIKVYNHNIVQYGRHVTFVVRIANIVNSHPHAKERVLRRPWRGGGMRRDAIAEFGNLIDEAENRRLIWCYKIRICCRPSVGKIIGEQC